MANHSTRKRVTNELKKSLSTKANTNPVKPQSRKPVQRHQSLRSDSINQKHPTNAFLEKSRNEFKRLETKIANELLTQIADLFGSESFADLSIIRGKYRKRVHSCLLVARVPDLYTRLLNLNLNKNAYNSQTNEYSVRIPPEIKESELKELIQKIYSNPSSDDIQRDETELMSKIEILNKTFSNDMTEADEQIKSHMNLSVNSDNNRSDDERNEYERNLNNSGDEEDANERQTSSGVGRQMVRSGTFELLTSIHSDDNNYDLKNGDNKCKTNDEIDLLDTIECKELNETNDTIGQKSPKANDSQNKSLNSMFSLFIDINEATDETKETQRPRTTRDDQRKGFDFIPLTGGPNKISNQRSCEARNQRRARNSADAVLIRSVDSALPNIKTVDDIPLLPMSPIVRKPPEVQRVVNEELPYLKMKGLGARKVDIESSCLSSSDSFSEAYNECMNISVQSSSKNSYESDSIDPFDDNQRKNDFIGDSDEESVASDEGKDIDLDLNDSQTFRNMKSCSKLGEDLLKMFVKQVNTDIVIRVKDREIKAHKCILTSRCRYFEAMLKGNWIESDSNRVDLQGFTYNSVYFALCHIYSGCLTLPDKLDLSELALLSDVLAMDSLKEIVVHELMVNRCHFFHAPCDDNCVVNIIKCMKLCARCGLDDLYHRCLNWSAKNFVKVWNRKAFAALSPPLTDACLQTKVKQLTADNVLKTTLETERMIAAQPRVKWSEPVFNVLGKLIEECCDAIATNYDRVVTSKDFLALGRGNSWDISQLEQTLLAAMTKLCPDVSCRALIELNKILLLQENHELNDDGFSYGPFNDLFARLVTKMQKYCERYMIQNANHVVHCQSWALLGPDCQQKIKDGAIIVFEFDKPIAPPPKLSSRLTSAPRKSTDGSRGDKSVGDIASKGAVPKNFAANSRAKTNPMNSRSNAAKRVATKKVANDHHIYDSVPFEDIPIKVADNKRQEFTRKVEKVSNRALSLHLNSRKSEEKIAKVSPFSVKSPDINSGDDSLSVKDLVAEIDAETNLVAHCLQEAELLELELTRKFQKTHIQPKTTGASVDTSNKSSANPTYGIVSQPQPKTRSHHKEAANGSARRAPVAKTQSTGTPILRTRPLPKVSSKQRK